MNLFPRRKKADKDDKPPAFNPSSGKGSDTPASGMSDLATPAAASGGKGSNIPVWSSGGSDKLAGNPLFRAGGLAGRSTVVDRLKGLKGRDLAFIAAGLGVLVMAPLAEYLMTGPEDASQAMKGGFAERGPLINDSASPFEGGPGGVGIAPGGLIGQDSDVITPLNVRDPSHLILGPGAAAQQPSATVTPPAAKPPSGGRDWSEAISAAKTGASRAVQRTPGLPRPNAKMAGALRGLAAAQASGGPNFRLEAPTSKGLFGVPRAGSSLTRVQAPPNYRGGGRSLAPGTGGGYGRFGGPGASGGGSAFDILTGGAPAGGSGISGGRPSAGDDTKNPGGNTNKDSRNTSITGENLALLRAKLELEKAIGLKWDKRRYDELDRKKMLEQIAAQTAAQTLSQALLKILDALLKGKAKDDKKGGDGGGKPAGGPTAPTAPPGGVPAPKKEPPAGVPGAGNGAPDATNARDGLKQAKQAVEEFCKVEALDKSEADLAKAATDARDGASEEGNQMAELYVKASAKLKGAREAAKETCGKMTEALTTLDKKITPDDAKVTLGGINVGIKQNVESVKTGVFEAVKNDTKIDETKLKELRPKVVPALPTQQEEHIKNIGALKQELVDPKTKFSGPDVVDKASLPELGTMATAVDEKLKALLDKPMGGAAPKIKADEAGKPILGLVEALTALQKFEEAAKLKGTKAFDLTETAAKASDDYAKTLTKPIGDKLTALIAAPEAAKDAKLRGEAEAAFAESEKKKTAAETALGGKTDGAPKPAPEEKQE